LVGISDQSTIWESPTLPKIMGDGIILQKTVLDSQKAILTSIETAVNQVKLLCTSPDDPDIIKKLGQSVKGITESIQNGYKTINLSTPGKKYCMETIDKITVATEEIDRAIVESAINSLDPKEDIIEKSALPDSIRAFSSLVEVIGKTVKNEPSQLGQTISTTPDTFQHV
jgi:hypothetical protein